MYLEDCFSGECPEEYPITTSREKLETSYNHTTNTWNIEYITVNPKVSTDPDSHSYREPLQRLSPRELHDLLKKWKLKNE